MFANPDTIKAHLNSIVNLAPPGVFSPLVDTGQTADKRRSQALVDASVVIGSRQVIEAVASNPAHSYWGQLKTDVSHSNRSKIKPHYGEIGVPLIGLQNQSFKREGIRADRDDIEGVMYSPGETVHNFYGNQFSVTPESTGRGKAYDFRYSTSGGMLFFTGYRCDIPMVARPEIVAEEEDYVLNHVPVSYTSTVALLALPFLLTEGDNLTSLALSLSQLGQTDLEEIKGGARKISPLNLTRAVELAQSVKL